MNIKRQGNSGCEIAKMIVKNDCTAITRFKNDCTGSNTIIKMFEKLPVNGYRNGTVDSKMLEYR